MPKKLLSILVPTYNYATGLELILGALSPLADDTELVIFDNSPGSELGEIAAKFMPNDPCIRYQHNLSVYPGPIGPGENWNALFDTAEGEYVMLLHNGEVPLGTDFLTQLRNRLKARGASDVLLLNLVLVDKTLQTGYTHLPQALRRLIPLFVPGYLYWRNVIGPTGTLVIRRTAVPRFDPMLKWLIDVDFYVRLCRADLTWCYADDLKIGSIQRDVGTLTAGFANQLSSIDSAERRILAKRYPRDRVWLGAFWGAPLRAIESVLWTALRASQVLVLKLFGWGRIR